MTIAILEDEYFIAQNLLRIVKGRGYDTRVYQSPNDILEDFRHRSKRTQLAMVDVNLNDELDGIDVASELKEKYGTNCMFITALSDGETLNRLKELRPLAYIVKPFTEREVLINLEIALNKIDSSKPMSANPATETDLVTFIKTSNGLNKINLRDVSYVEAYDNYIKIHSGTKVLITKTPLKDFIQKVNCPFLVQIHRSFVINVHELDAIFGNMAMVGTRQIPIGKTYRDQLDDFVVI